MDPSHDESTLKWWRRQLAIRAAAAGQPGLGYTVYICLFPEMEVMMSNYSLRTAGGTWWGCEPAQKNGEAATVCSGGRHGC